MKQIAIFILCVATHGPALAQQTALAPDYGLAVIKQYPDADTDGDGVLSSREAIALLAKLKQNDGVPPHHLKSFQPTRKQLTTTIAFGNVLPAKESLSFEKGHGMRVVMTGHSGVYPARNTLPGIAMAAGFKDHHQRSHLSGSERGSANAIWLWEFGQFYELPARPILLPAIATGTWDVMTWGAFYDDRPQHYSQWIDICLQANPDMKFYIQEIWPHVPRAATRLVASEIVKQVAAQHVERQRGIYRPVYEALNKKYPGKVRIIPASASVVEMLRLYAAGELPDLDCLDEDKGRRGRRGIYTDGSHLSRGLEHLIGYVYFAMLYGQDPELIENYRPNDVPERLDHTMRSVAWHAVTESPYGRHAGANER